MHSASWLYQLRWWDNNKERIWEHQKRVAEYRNSCAEYNNFSTSATWGSSASSSHDTWTPPTLPFQPVPPPAYAPLVTIPDPPPAHAPVPPLVTIPDPPQALPNNSTQQQLFQMHHNLATAQMTMMTQLAQTNTQQSQAMLRTLMEVMLRIGSNRA